MRIRTRWTTVVLGAIAAIAAGALAWESFRRVPVDVTPPRRPPPSFRASADAGDEIVVRVVRVDSGSYGVAVFDAQCVELGRCAVDDPWLSDLVRRAGVTRARVGSAADVPYSEIVRALDVLRDGGAGEVRFEATPLLRDDGG